MPGVTTRLYRPRWIDLAAVALIAGLALSIALVGITNESLSYDESATALWSAYPMADIKDVTPVEDHHPPAYYMGIRAWNLLAGRDDVLWLRLPSALSTVLTACLVYCIGCVALRNRWAGIFGALLYMTSPYVVEHAQTATSYGVIHLPLAAGLLCLLIGLRKYGDGSAPPVVGRGGLSLCRFLWRRGGLDGHAVAADLVWLAYGASILLTIYIHHLYVVYGMIQGLAFLCALAATPGHRLKHLLNFSIVGAVFVAVYLATYLPFLISSAHVYAGRNLWIHRNIAETVTWVYGGDAYIFLAIAVGLLAAGAVFWWRRGRREWAPFAILLLVPVVMTAAVIVLHHTTDLQTMRGKVLIGTVAPWMALIGCAAALLRPRVVAPVAMTVLLALNGAGLYGIYKTGHNYPWDMVSEFLVVAMEPGDAMVVCPDITRRTFLYDWREMPRTWEPAIYVQLDEHFWLVPGASSRNPHDWVELQSLSETRDSERAADLLRRHGRVWRASSRSRCLQDNYAGQFLRAGRQVNIQPLVHKFLASRDDAGDVRRWHSTIAWSSPHRLALFVEK